MLHCRGDENPREGGQRDPRDHVGELASTTTSSTSEWMTPARRECAPGADVDGGARDRRGRRDAAQERGHQVGEPLAEQLAVGVVAFADAHRVGDGRRHEALECGQGGNREGRDEEDAHDQPRIDRRP